MLLYSRILSRVMNAETISNHGNSSKVKESETSKNEASSKSQRSRRNIMQRTFLFVAVFFVNIVNTLAQDVITLKNGDEIQALVQEIGDVDIKYKKIENQQGPNYTLKKSEIFMIKYANGSKDVFTDQQNPYIEKKEGIQHTEASSITALNAKELEQVLAEASEKLSNYEKSYTELIRAEGIVYFYENYTKVTSLATRTLKSDNNITKQIFSEVTGGMTYEELDMDIENHFGPTRVRKDISFDHPFGGKRGGLVSGFDLVGKFENFLDFYRKKITELTPIFERTLTDMEQSAVMIIPPDYRYSYAMETMHSFFRNRRASTWKECADLYEEHVHRTIMQKNSAESIRIQREIGYNTASAARSARAAAIFSGLNFIFN